METLQYWEENGHTVKYDNYNSNDGFGRAAGDQLNFAAPSEDEAEYPPGAYLKKGKVSRQDPMSHRIIEKRRRDRMNNCLADLSRLIPPEYLKKGRGRVEKTEIIEMAIRHLKFLQDRANAAERQSEDTFRAGYQEAVGEAVRFLVEVQGYEPGDGLCVALTSHLQRRVEVVTKGEVLPRDNPRHTGGNSSETTSSSSSSQGFTMKPSVMAQAPPPAPPNFAEAYDALAESFAMDYDGVPVSQFAGGAESELLSEEPLPLDGRRKRSPATLRTVRKPEHSEDYLHSYKFKNSIERRFSRSQDNEATDMSRAAHAPVKLYSHKRRRAARPAPAPAPARAPAPAPAPPAPPSACTSTSASASTEETRDTSPQDTSSDSAHHHHYEKPPPTQYVPVFALNALGKYYVPLSVDYECLARYLGPYDVLDARAVHLAAPLHPVTIHVNFQPCLNYHVKRERSDRDRDRDWRPV